MNLFVVGATGRTGQLVTAQAMSKLQVSVAFNFLTFFENDLR